ncbi:MAG: DUF3822 family protein [Flavobacteriales bacterium]|nr:DUF3822 family protein [Flavobacteriales bacterium]MBP9078622.1 DUF3822 family protein [Flavobacteriales bacterium]
MLIETFHPRYDPAREHTWHLSCWLAPGLQAWCVHDRASGLVMGLVSQGGEHLPLLEQLPTKPASVSFTAMPEISTLVPQSSLVPGTELQHLKLVHGTVPTGLLRDEPIGSLGAQCIYLHDEQAERKLLDRFPGARSLPLQGTLVNHGLSRSAEGPVAVLHRTTTRLDLVLADKGRLLLSNTYYATAPEDVLYYTLFALKECGLSPDTTSLRAGGPQLAASEEHLLSNYFAHGPLPSTGTGDPALAQLAIPDAYHWTGLIEQYPCAS